MDHVISFLTSWTNWLLQCPNKANKAAKRRQMVSHRVFTENSQETPLHCASSGSFCLMVKESEKKIGFLSLLIEEGEEGCVTHGALWLLYMEEGHVRSIWITSSSSSDSKTKMKRWEKRCHFLEISCRRQNSFRVLLFLLFCDLLSYTSLRLTSQFVSLSSSSFHPHWFPSPSSPSSSQEDVMSCPAARDFLLYQHVVYVLLLQYNQRHSKRREERKEETRREEKRGDS